MNHIVPVDFADKENEHAAIVSLSRRGDCNFCHRR
jgi:hypothetical protein